MKTTLFSLSFILLAWVLGCKKPPVQDQIDPNPPQPPANCKIVRTTYKDPTTGREANLIKEPETITLDDGVKVQVSRVDQTTYKYDGQGRIIEEREQLLSDDYRLMKYTYTPTSLMIETESLAHNSSDKPYTRLDTIPLDAQGNRTRYHSLGKPYLFYNEDGQVIDVDNIPGNNTVPYGQTHQYTDGNLAQQTLTADWVQRDGQWVGSDVWYKHYRYNVSRPNLPIIYQYQGKPSRNLPVEELWYVSALGQAPVYRKTLTYTYDKLGRVKRRIAYGRSLNRSWLIEDDLYGVGVTDYEYECP